MSGETYPSVTSGDADVDAQQPPASTERPDAPRDEASAPRGPQYKGAPLEAAKGPGLGCFWIQVVVLGVLVVVTPLGVASGWPIEVTGTLLILTLVLLLFAGQTIIFLLRLVAADRRSRRRPLAATARRTVGDLEEDADRLEAQGGRGSGSGSTT